jgi:hypothetical protein
MKILKILFLVLSIYLFTDSALKNQPISPELTAEILKNYKPDTIEYEIRGDLYDFMDAVGKKESNGRYNIVSRYGYLGKYQFSSKTLRGLGIYTSHSEFLKNPRLQDEAMVKLLKKNKERLQPYIDKHTLDGTSVQNVLIINNTPITESGILAAAHLGGPGSIVTYFERGQVSRDAFGTSITYYMVRFSGYKLEL